MNNLHLIDKAPLLIRMPEEAVNVSLLIGQTIAIHGTEYKVRGIRCCAEAPSHFIIEASELEEAKKPRGHHVRMAKKGELSCTTKSSDT